MSTQNPTPSPLQQVVMIDHVQAAREALARELAEMAKNPPDETVPGGRYVRADGAVVDAEGKVLEAAEGASDEDESAKRTASAPVKGRR